MVFVPPTSIVLDVNALAAGTPREWIEFSRAGSVYIPQVVYEELRFTFDRSPDPDLEQLARNFNRFYPTSGWQVSDAVAHHALLKVATGQALTHRARISLAVARCAYGLATSTPANLVVMVTGDRALIQKVQEVGANNLCAITGQALLQWCRTGQRPVAVSQKLQQLRVVNSVQAGLISHLPMEAGVSKAAGNRSTSQSRTATKTKPRPKPKPVIVETNSALQVWALIRAGAGLAIAGFLVWMLINHSGSWLSQDLWKPVDPTQQQ